MNESKLLQVAEVCAREAGAMLLKKWQSPLEISSKGYRDLVTDADLASQNMIVGHILSHFPEHGFIAEEDEGKLPAFGKVRWVIDPVDGTTNYSRHLPNFCVSIAAVDENDQTIVGVIYNPVGDEMFTAIRGQGSFCNGKRLQGSPCQEMIQAVVGFDWSRDPRQRQAILHTVNDLAPQVHTMRALRSAALGLAYVAAGRVEAYFNFGLKAWDAAAGCLLIREAGGQITNLAGDDWGLFDNGCLASNQPLAPFLRDSTSRTA